MFPFASRVHRVESLRRSLERTPLPTHHLMSEVLRVVCPHRLAARDDRSVQLRQWLETHAFLQIALALVEWELPDWSVRRLGQENRIWWCAITHRHMIDWGGEEEDESHEDMTLAILKSFLTVLCHLPAESQPQTPALAGAARQSSGGESRAPSVGLYGILIKKLGATSRSFMQQVK